MQNEMKAVVVEGEWAINILIGGVSFLGDKRYKTEEKALKTIWRINTTGDLNAWVHGDPEVEADMARDPEWPAPSDWERLQQRTPHVWNWRNKTAAR